jgi:hypothetical protein
MLRSYCVHVVYSGILWGHSVPLPPSSTTKLTGTWALQVYYSSDSEQEYLLIITDRLDPISVSSVYLHGGDPLGGVKKVKVRRQALHLLARTLKEYFLPRYQRCPPRARQTQLPHLQARS